MAAAVFICDGIRTPFARYGGKLSTIRPDDLGAVPIKALMERNRGVHWEQIDDVIYGCANQAGEDNRNVARMVVLLAGLPITTSATTVNRLCGSGMDAIRIGASLVQSGSADLIIAGGVESMSRAPFVVSKSSTAFARNVALEDTTIGWRFVNPLIEHQYGIDLMPETAENVAEQFQVSRADQDAFALRSQQKAAQAQQADLFAEEIVPVPIPVSRKQKEPLIFSEDEQPRPDTTLSGLEKLPTPFRMNGTVTAGNSSSVNDGACAVLMASEKAVKQHNLTPRTQVVAAATVGLEPRIMGMGPVAASEKLFAQVDCTISDMDIIELNEAFAAQSLAVIRSWKLPDDAAQINPQGGAIALGHPLGASGARLATTATYQLCRTGGRYALCTMCIGVGQGIALLIERV